MCARVTLATGVTLANVDVLVASQSPAMDMGSVPVLGNAGV